MQGLPSLLTKAAALLRAVFLAWVATLPTEAQQATYCCRLPSRARSGTLQHPKATAWHPQPSMAIRDREAQGAQVWLPTLSMITARASEIGTAVDMLSSTVDVPTHSIRNAVVPCTTTCIRHDTQGGAGNPLQHPSMDGVWLLNHVQVIHLCRAQSTHHIISKLALVAGVRLKDDPHTDVCCCGHLLRMSHWQLPIKELTSGAVLDRGPWREVLLQLLWVSLSPAW